MRALRRSVPGACVVVAGALALGGCAEVASHRAGADVPSYVTEPFTAQEKRIEAGARLVVADGCSTCHLHGHSPVPAPSFSSFAGHSFTLTDGRRVVIDEAFVHEGLLHPGADVLAGYPAQPMIAALAHLRLAREPRQLAAIAAFIEQVGPEAE